MVNVPVPLFLNDIYQPAVKPDTAGNVIVLDPEFQTYVAARLELEIVGGDVTSIMLPVVAS